MTIQPIRIQRKRTKGWKMPENTVCVDRSTNWGNPYAVGNRLDKGPYAGTVVRDSAHAVELYEAWAIEALAGRGIDITAAESKVNLEKLRGKNLACFCKLDQPCHADVLLELANAG